MPIISEPSVHHIGIDINKDKNMDIFNVEI